MSDVAAEIKVGDTAPDFTLKDQDQKDVKLSEFRGTSCNYLILRGFADFLKWRVRSCRW